MVFGFLGLAKDAERFYDLVDYLSPLETFYLRLAQRFTDLGHGAEILLQASNSEYTGDLPSWVPNWSPSSREPSVTTHQYSPIRTKDFCAGGEGFDEFMEVLQDGNDGHRPMLKVRGAFIDMIQHCSLAAQSKEIMPWVHETHSFTPPFEMRDGTLSITFLFALQGFRFALKHVPKDQGNGVQSFLEVCCQVTQNFYDDQSHHSLRLGFLQFVSMYMQNNSYVEKMRGDFRPQDEMLPMKDFVNDALAPLGRQRRFCTTKLGLLGMVPFDCKPGDKVFVPRGGAIPLILRPVKSGLAAEDKDQSYQLIGDAYIRGVMYGEGLSFDGVQESDLLWYEIAVDTQNKW